MHFIHAPPSVFGICPRTVHEPLEVPDEYRAWYNDSGSRAFVPHVPTQTYCAMATALDSAVGAIVDAVNGSGALPETLIVFTSDNVSGSHAQPMPGRLCWHVPCLSGSGDTRPMWPCRAQWRRGG